MALITTDPWKIVKELYSDLKNLSVSSNLYYARKNLKEQVRLYSDTTLQEIAEVLLAETDANVDGASVLFGIIGSVRAQREQTSALVPYSPALTNKKLQFENFLYLNYRPFLHYPSACMKLEMNLQCSAYIIYAHCLVLKLQLLPGLMPRCNRLLCVPNQNL